ncbi:MAG: radical SAM protein [Thermoplasmata archaeon]
MPKRSAYTGKLPKGCALCERGAKLVLLVTGKCGRRCFYCPLSEEKRGHDVFFANERRVSQLEHVILEAELMDALGTGVTGGDPLCAIDRTVESIRALKKRFGKSHHVHMYTSTTDTRRIERVAGAGLDEIRFHPPVSMWMRLHKTAFDNAISRSKKLGMDVGLEIPVIPGRSSELVSAIAFADSMDLDFVNLNELEFSETNWRSLRSLRFDVKDDISSGVRGSEELALDLLKLETSIPLHYCSASFKDGVQLRRRIIRRAKNVRRPHEVLTKDGTFIKGIVETELAAATAAWIMKKFGVPGDLIWSDYKKKRLEIAPWVLEEIADELDQPAFIIEEYPTADRLEVERRPLRRR